MKSFIKLLFTILLLSSQLIAQSTQAQKKYLFPIVENGLWGYIDTAGKVIIKPQYFAAGQFSEGLAPVRSKGTYGFINHKAEFVIPPQYDVAYSFENGQAKVYVEGKPYYINRNGEKTFEHNFSEILGFSGLNYSTVITPSEKFGLINKKGELLADTSFKRINAFENGLATVIGLNHDPYPDDDKDPIIEKGVINAKGKLIVPYGKYKEISDFKNGFAKVEINTEEEKDWHDKTGIIDHNGKLKFVLPPKKWHFDYGNENYSEGLATADIYSVDPDTIKVWGGNNRHTYKGVVNAQGKILFSDQSWDEISPFKYNRAFVKDTNKNWYLINRNGQILNQKPFDEILYSVYNGDPKYLFQNAMQMVKTKEGWGAIDTNGNFVLKPRELDFNHRDMYWRGNILFTEEYSKEEDKKYTYEYGFWNIKSGLIVEPQFHSINLIEFKDDLIYVVEDDRIGYINQLGKYIWREKLQKKQNTADFNIDYMNRGYFYAYSPYQEELAGFGGWGGSRNAFQVMSDSNQFERNKLNIAIKPESKDKYWETYEGIKLYVSNTSKDTCYFDAQDSRLYLKIQAKDKHGNWRDIEYLPSSWCGNSYHSLFLPPEYYWEFVIPKYTGEFKTKLRAELLYKRDHKQEESEVLYSNEFEGSINPGQFWRKNQYYPLGLMDPYND